MKLRFAFFVAALGLGWGLAQAQSDDCGCQAKLQACYAAHQQGCLKMYQVCMSRCG